MARSLTRGSLTSLSVVSCVSVGILRLGILLQGCPRLALEHAMYVA